MSLQEFIADLPQMKGRVLSSIHTALYAEAVNLIEEFKLRSPLDKDVFRKNWELVNGQKSVGDISSLRIQNRTPYGIFLDEGGEPGGVPWYWPNSKNKKPSGKLIVRNGRVWAGGKSPSGFVIGGITNVVVYRNPSRQRQMAMNIAKSVIEAI